VIPQVHTRSTGLPACRFPDAQFIIADDDEAAVDALARILRAAGYRAIRTTTDSCEVDVLVQQSEPDLVLLDLHMPERDGIAVLRDLRAAALPRSYLPVLMVTGDPSQTERRRALAAGATDFVMKPYEIDEVLLRIGNLLETRYLHRELRRHSHSLELRVAVRTAELDAAHVDTLKRLALAAEFRDDETGRHTERVGEIAAILASALGLPEEDARLIGQAAPLHDVGKIGIPDAILRKPGPLTETEWATMKQHTTIGARLLAGGQSRIVRLAEQIALTHHEHWNGLGYPRGLAGDAIPLAGRIVMVADVFDALLSDRVYRTAWGVERVLGYITGHAGQRFDPRIAALCDVPGVRDALIATHASQLEPDDARSESVG
jgi:putative two-component system response regulator